MLIKPSLCTGCLACYYACSEKAIDLKVIDTFLYPTINSSKCTKCGKCGRLCQEINNKSQSVHNEFCYAVHGGDSIRAASSSGGVFYLVAQYFLSLGGYVCGAAFIDGKVKHILVNTIDDLKLLQKSKYIESDCYHAYGEIEQLLSENKKILFSGTPCQCSAVRTLFKNHENLYIIDLLCHGVPSQKLFDIYIAEEHNNEKIKKIDFRYKEDYGWNPTLMLHMQCESKNCIISSLDDSFYYSFLWSYSLRESCLYCKYAVTAREGNITLGDFWGIDAVDQTINDKKGTSIVLINDKKGEILISKIKNELHLFREFPIDVAKKHVPIRRRPYNYTSKRREFFSMIKTDTIKTAQTKLKNNIADCGIINYWWCDDNGAILTAFALQNIIAEIGYTSRLINLSESGMRNGISQQFEIKYLCTTEPVNSSEQFAQLNKSFNNFIVGSDQVFRADWVNDHWFLDFVDFHKNKIAVSASFGIDTLNVSAERRKKIQLLLSRFNKISIRELSGVQLCKMLGVKADYVIDPVFILDTAYYINLEKDSKVVLPQHEYIFCYFRDYDEAIDAVLQTYAKTLSLQIIRADDQTDVVDFLKLIHNAKMIITDSYHGLCFSLIFNKPYICYYNIMRGKTRFDALIKVLQLNQNNFVSDMEDIQADKLFVENWNSVNANIAFFRTSGKNWIKNALEKKQKINLFKFAIRYIHDNLSKKYHKSKNRIKRIVKRVIRLLRGK